MKLVMLIKAHMPVCVVVERFWLDMVSVARESCVTFEASLRPAFD